MALEQNPNIEIGAGRGAFGVRFHPPCLATDIRLLPGIAVVTDAKQLALRAETFSKVVICNPYGYGFRMGEGMELMRELVRVLRPGGTIIVVGHSTNKYCQFARIVTIAESLSGEGMSLAVERRDISPAQDFPGHHFRRVDGSTTVPDVEIRVMVRP